jgi:NAD(P)-dependent dehydrogenase (short-subunit alcohol dehydrogenase family)
MSEPAQLKGMIAVVTGATAGMGLEAAVQLAERGAALVLIGRDERRTLEALATVKARSGSAQVSFLLCDFASLAQTRRLVEDLKRTCPRLDLLINNAGSVSAKRELTEDGYEKTFAVNHLGFFVLTCGLLDLLKRSAPARIVNVASAGHFQGSIDFADLHYAQHSFSTFGAYARSKLANVLFTLELARRLEGTQVTVNCLHPGAVATNIWSHVSKWSRWLMSLALPLMRSPKQAADVIIHLATAPELEGVSGRYFNLFKDVAPSKAARDPQLAARLWQVSEELTRTAPPETAHR